MALSDVLQFDCYLDNEIARSATRDFAGMLGKAFEQYKKLWNEYLILRNHCENAHFKIPFELLESDSYINKDINASNSQMASRSSKIFTPLYGSIPISCNSETASNTDNGGFSDNKTVEEKESMLLGSPILIKKCSKSKKRCVPFVFDNAEEKHAVVPIKENISMVIDSPEKNILPVALKEDEYLINEHSNDAIECTPTVRVSNKLGISNLYNVDTTIMQNGKKLRQSKLVFLSNEQSEQTKTAKKYIRSEPLRSHVSPTPKQNTEKQLKYEEKLEEEIIESSPNKRMKSNLKMKSLRLKRKDPKKNTDERKNKMYEGSSDKSSDFKLAVKEMNQPSFDLNLPPVYTSTQEDQPFFIRKPKNIDSFNKNTEGNYGILSSPSPPELIFDENLYRGSVDHLSTPIKRLELKGNIKAGETSNIYSRSASQLQDSKFSLNNDETFCLLGEELKKNKLTNIKKNINESKMVQKAQPVKKILMSSFDIPPEKKDTHFDKPSKKKSDRAKLHGVSCWECEKYYANLGLSEEEIKVRQKQCSRHRSKFTEREKSPEGFWNHLFPDTLSSTFQD